MARMPIADYDTLERFIETVLRRLAEGKTDTLSAEQDIMHPLTAWDQSVAQEFVPWMKDAMEEWAKVDAL